MLQMTLRGSAYDRGVQHGRALSELVRERAHRTVVELEAKAAPDLVAERLDRITGNLGLHTPESLEEIAGIAEGARLPLRDVLLLNVGAEITHELSEWYGCTNIAFAGTPDGTILGKNSDGDPVSLRYAAVQRTLPDRGIPMLRVVYAGSISSSGGINDAGLAYVGASIMTKDSNWDGVSLSALTAQLLATCATVDEAVAVAERLPVLNHSANLMLADASGRAAVVERLPHASGVRWLEGETLYNTNHTACLETSPYCSASPDFIENSQARIARLEGLVAQAERSVDGMAAVLRSHAASGSICQHGQAGLYTIISFICVPARRAMLVTDTCPCLAEYRRYQVETAVGVH